MFFFDEDIVIIWDFFLVFRSKKIVTFIWMKMGNTKKKQYKIYNSIQFDNVTIFQYFLHLNNSTGKIDLLKSNAFCQLCILNPIFFRFKD